MPSFIFGCIGITRFPTLHIFSASWNLNPSIDMDTHMTPDVGENLGGAPEAARNAGGNFPEGEGRLHSGGRRRRSHRGRRGSILGMAGGRNKGSRGRRGGGRHDARKRNERMIIVVCFVLSIAAAGFAGFVAGQRFDKGFDKSASEKSAVLTEAVLPTSASESLLDEAFASLTSENYRKALLDFQKVQGIQPSLPGIDYLIGNAALLTGEYALAEQSLRQSLSKKELEDESQLLLALVEFRKSGVRGSPVQKMADPVSVAESAFRHYASLRPADPSVYDQWADLLRSNGSYRSAADLLHKGVLRSDASLNESYLSAKEALTRLQNDPSKEVPSMSGITSMSGEQALVAACIALQQKRVNEAVFFLERAREFYRPNLFRKLLKDPVFDEFRSEPKIKDVLQKNESA